MDNFADIIAVCLFASVPFIFMIGCIIAIVHGVRLHRGRMDAAWIATQTRKQMMKG